MEHPFPFGKGMNLAFTPIRCEGKVDCGLAVRVGLCFLQEVVLLDSGRRPQAGWSLRRLFHSSAWATDRQAIVGFADGYKRRYKLPALCQRGHPGRRRID